MQFWLWGQDVRHPGGNRLLELGMKRYPAPGAPGHSRYEFPCGNQRVVLWGWGLAFLNSSPYGLLLLRSFRVPVLVLPEHTCNIWRLHDLPLPVGHIDPPAYEQVTDQALGQAIHWIASYERWMAQAAPPFAIEPGHDFPPIPHRSEVASGWDALAAARWGTNAAHGSIPLIAKTD